MLVKKIIKLKYFHLDLQKTFTATPSIISILTLYLPSYTIFRLKLYLTTATHNFKLLLISLSELCFLRLNIYKSGYIYTHFIPNNSDLMKQF